MAAAELRRVHLDANFLIELGAARPERVHRIARWLREDFLIQVSAVAWSEFLCGPLMESELADARAVVHSVDAFTEEHSTLAAELFNLTGRRTRSHVDCMIAAHAIRREAALATANATDFRPFLRFGLKLA
ncbi:MAG: PIN domain-containing protein [Verrucomicrobiota bacterium]|nr:PIN domain-containing protein [Verrucomicrobiota bacterium]